MKKLKKYLEFLKEEYQLTLSYYCFDWDDNLLSMPTRINMEKLVDGKWIPVAVSTEHFAEIRNDKENWKLGQDPFIEFCDDGLFK